MQFHEQVSERIPFPRRQSGGDFLINLKKGCLRFIMECCGLLGERHTNDSLVMLVSLTLDPAVTLHPLEDVGDRCWTDMLCVRDFSLCDSVVMPEMHQYEALASVETDLLHLHPKAIGAETADDGYQLGQRHLLGRVKRLLGH